MRSWLFVPGDSARKQQKSLDCGADVLILDLEDSVAASEKEAARNMTRDFITATKPSQRRPKLYVRVNDLGTGLTAADLDGVMPAGPDGIMLPKAVGGRDLIELDNRLSAAESELGLASGATRIIPVATETAAAVLALPSVSGSTKRMVALTWGAEDLAADVGAESNIESGDTYTTPYLVTRALALFAAVASAVDPIDTAYVNYKDTDKFAADCRISRRDGFVGRIAIHPAQVPVINETYSPSAAAIARARKIVQAFDSNPGLGVIGIDGEMLDMPHYRQAKRILRRIEATE